MKIGRKPLYGHEPLDLKQKIKIAAFVISLGMVILVFRLAYLQLIKGEEFQKKSENNSIRFRQIKPLRGLIRDRNGVVLVDNKPSFDIVFMPSKKKGSDVSVEKLRELYKNKSLEFSFDTALLKNVPPYIPVRLEKNVSLDKVALIETNALDLPGIYIDVTPIRLYLDGEILAPIIGYTGEVSKEDIAKSNGAYSYGDILGKHGLEKFFDAYLRGRRGAELVEVNAFGREIKNLGKIEPLSGYNITLTIDADLQKAAWEALQGRPGAAVVLDP
ncbi:MAG TPA: hypothetical protein P5040_07300, partial [Smithella sp.]|nr:hypothetical protein [Smithella sp.]